MILNGTFYSNRNTYMGSRGDLRYIVWGSFIVMQYSSNQYVRVWIHNPVLHMNRQEQLEDNISRLGDYFKPLEILDDYCKVES